MGPYRAYPGFHFERAPQIARLYGPPSRGAAVKALAIDFEDWRQTLEIEREQWNCFEDRIAWSWCSRDGGSRRAHRPSRATAVGGRAMSNLRH
jgi:hypothetical protein